VRNLHTGKQKKCKYYWVYLKHSSREDTL
jgi:hypothetical protein